MERLPGNDLEFFGAPEGLIDLASDVTGLLPLANGGTAALLADPGADSILFWDDSAGAVTWLAPGNSIVITTTTLDTIQDIRTTATPQFLREGLGAAAAAVVTLNIAVNDSVRVTPVIDVVNAGTGDAGIRLTAGGGTAWVMAVQNDATGDPLVFANGVAVGNGAGDIGASDVLRLGGGAVHVINRLELEHLTDTTFTRVSAGVVAIEGSNILLASGLGSITQAYDADLTVIAGLADPNADRILFWDDSAGSYAFLAPGNSIAITATTIDTIQDIRTTATPQFTRLGLGSAAHAAYDLYVFVASASKTASTDADEIVVEGSGTTGITILGGGTENIFFGNSTSALDSYIQSRRDTTNLRFGTNAAGVEGNLSSTGVWTDSSGADEKAYEGSGAMVWGSVCTKLKSLFIGPYRAKAVVHPGPFDCRNCSPTAEDFWDMFGLGVDPRHPKNHPGIAAKDLASIALCAVQELIAYNESLRERVKVLEESIL